MRQPVGVVALALLVALAWVAGPVQAQEPDDLPGLKHRVEELEARVSELEDQVGTVSDWPLDLFVDGTSGDDQSDGLSWTNAKRTIQAAVNAIPQVMAGDATVHIADGTYSEFVWIGRRARLGVFAVSLVGNESAPDNVVLDGQSIIEGAFLIDDFYVFLSGMSMRGFAEAVQANEALVSVHDCRFEENTDAAIFAANSTLQLVRVVVWNNPGDGISVRNSFLEDFTDCQITGNDGNGISLSTSVLGGRQLQISNNGAFGIESTESSHVNLYYDFDIVIQNNAGGDLQATYSSSIRGYGNGTTGACQADASSVCEP